MRLLLPAFAALLISAVLCASTHSLPWKGQAKWMATLWASPTTWDDLTRQALLVAPESGYQLNNVLWSLAIEWRVSVFMPLLALPAVIWGRQGVLVLLLSWVGVGCAVGGMAGDHLDAGTSLLGALRSMGYFVLPFALGAGLERSDLAGIRLSGAVQVSAWVAVAGLLRISSDLAVFAASCVAIVFVQQDGPVRSAMRRPAMVWLGRISFSLYLTHELILATLHHGLHAALPAPAIFCLSMAAAIPAAWVFHCCVEWPTHRLARAADRTHLRRLATTPA